jgi:hypothetical protein
VRSHRRHRREESPPREESKLKGLWRAIAAH